MIPIRSVYQVGTSNHTEEIGAFDFGNRTNKKSQK
jgi:hypothetical protein